MLTRTITGVPCPLCQATSSVAVQEHRGYQEGHQYQIRECEYCDLQFAHPMAIPAGLYESIYNNADLLPGYSRYAGYRNQAKMEAQPLDWLAEQEPAFAFIRSELRRLPRSARILEVGSGLGYLTYSIHSAGYSITGIDISKSAVDTATATFGQLYLHKDLFELADEEPGTFDAIILTEVIEHLPDPLMFLSKVSLLLKTGGGALITTPNKSNSPAKARWHTDNPPVHLWWFSETSIRRLAQISGLGIRLHDFSTPDGEPTKEATNGDSLVGRPPWLTESGTLTAESRGWMQMHDKNRERNRMIKRRLKWVWPMLKNVSDLKNGNELLKQRSSQIGAVFTKY